MLRLNAEVRFKATAKINRVALQAEFTVECLLLDNQRLDELREQQAAGKITTNQFIKSWLVGWPHGEVADAQGQPVDFSDKALDDLLRVPGAPIAVVQAFYRGYDEATEGNCAPLPAGS